MKLLLEPSKCTKEQREAIAGFILTYPSTAREEIDNGEDRPLSPATLRAVETLKTEDSPEAAFGLSIPQPPPATPGPQLVPPPPPAPGVIATDKNGLPWDSRIHASTKVISTDGTWRKRRGVDDAVVTQVEAELRQVMSIPVRPTAATIPEPAPLACPVVTEIPAVPAAPVNDSAPYFDLINRCSALMTDGKAKREEIQAICIAVGLPSLALLGTRKDLVPEISKAVEALVADR